MNKRIWKLSLFLLGLVIGVVTVLTQNQADASSYRSENLTFTSNGNRIYGRLLVPNRAGKKPVVIVSHGFGGNHNQELALQRQLVRAGNVVYAIDFAGGDGYETGRSQGSNTDMSVMTEVQNLEDAINAVKQKSYVNANRLYLVGASQGGVVSSIVASQHPKKVTGLILLYPAFSLFHDAHERYSSEQDIPNRTNIMGITVGRRYYTDIWNYDIYKQIQKYTGPVSIYYGSSDDIVPESYERRAQRSFKNASLRIIRGEGHGFSTQTSSRVGRQVAKFIQNHR